MTLLMIPQLEALLKTHAPECPGPLSFIKLHNGSARRNPKVSFVVFSGRTPCLFLKSVRLPEDTAVIEHAHACLKAANAWVSTHMLPVALPKALWVSRIDPVVVSAESLVPGRALDPTSPEECTLGLNLLKAWAMAGAKTSHDTLDHAAHIQGWLSDIKLESSAVKSLIEETYTRVAAQAFSLPAIPQHGDCTQSNFLVEGRTLGLIDWDRFGDIQLPLFDLLTFIERITPKKENPLQAHKKTIDELLAILHVDPSALPLLVCLFAVATEWRKRLRFHPYETEQLDERFGKNFEQTMHWLHP